MPKAQTSLALNNTHTHYSFMARHQLDIILTTAHKVNTAASLEPKVSPPRQFSTHHGCACTEYVMLDIWTSSRKDSPESIMPYVRPRINIGSLTLTIGRQFQSSGHSCAASCD